MAKVFWKFKLADSLEELAKKKVSAISVPAGAQLTSIEQTHSEGTSVNAYYICDDLESSKDLRYFVCCLTGESLNEHYLPTREEAAKAHIFSFPSVMGQIVLHVFESE